MFSDLLSRLFSESSARKQLEAEDAEVAIAALLVRVARVDNRYEDLEKQRIDQILSRRLGVSAADASERRAAAEMIEAEAPDTVRFTRQIKDCVALEDRNEVIAAMWEIALADNSRVAEEDATIRLVAGLLGVTDQDSGLIRQNVIRNIGK